MQTAKLKDLFVIDRSSKIRAKDAIIHGRYPFYTSGEIVKYLNTYQYNTKGMIIGTGGNPNLHFAEGTFSMSSDCCLLTNKSNRQEVVDVKYAYYFLCARPFILQRLYKGAGMKHISLSDIKEIEIFYPDTAAQRAIVTIMSFLDDVIERRRNAKEDFSKILFHYYLSLIDKSNGWEEVTIKDISSEIKSGPFGSQLRKDQIKENGEIYVLGIDDVKNKVVSKQRASYLPIQELDRYKRYLVKEFDVLFSIMGSVGKSGYSAIVPKDFGLAINTKHLADITLNLKLCNPYFLSYALKNDPYIEAQIKTSKRGAIMDGLNLTDVRGIKIKLPNMKAQSRFEKIYSLHMDIERNMGKELSLLGELRISLLNRYFSGNDNSLQQNRVNHHADDVEAVIRLVEQGSFSDVANYDEMRNLLYHYLEQEMVTQVYDEKSQSLKLHINETHKA